MKATKYLSILLSLLLSGTLSAQIVNFGNFTDPRDGTTYKTVTIGNQTWMAENLNYNTDTGSWVYDNNLTKPSIYGRLYSWPTACEVCPEGWNLPSDMEWHTLTEYLGGLLSAGGKIKETGTTCWNSPNVGATNESGFSALPAGYYFDGEFYDIGKSASFWSSTASGYEDQYAWHRFLYHSIPAVYRYRYNYLKFGYSVRCIRDNGNDDSN